MVSVIDTKIETSGQCYISKTVSVSRTYTSVGSFYATGQKEWLIHIHLTKEKRNTLGIAIRNVPIDIKHMRAHVLA